MRINLRKTELSDMEMIYHWANDETTRKNSFHTEKIEFDEHHKWFEKNMVDANIHMLVLTADSNPIGQVRLSIESDATIISYSIANEFRGHGYATEMIPAVEEYVLNNCHSVNTIIGYVRESNVASKRVFEKNGYACERILMPYQCLEYRKILKG